MATAAAHPLVATRNQTPQENGAQGGWRAAARVLRGPLAVAHDLVAVAFPADCRVCDGPLGEASLLPVCGACLHRLCPADLPCCHRCGEAADFDIGLEDRSLAQSLHDDLLCRVCRLAPPEFARAVSFGTYDGELRSLVHLLKFEGVRGAAGPLGRCLAQAMTALEPLAGPEPLLIAVPLHPARERQRGYNQSALLAREAVRCLRRTHPAWTLQPAHDLLRRTRRTESQFALSPRGRRENLRGAFAVQGEVAGRQVILVDDILTSGATARECARVLRRAGAAQVWVATVTRAQKERVTRQHREPKELVARWTLAANADEAGSERAI